MSLIGWKIRNRKTGLFTEGGRYADAGFSQHGKVWWDVKSLLGFLQYLKRDGEAIQKSNRESAEKWNKSAESPRPRRKKVPVPALKDFEFDPDWDVVEFELSERSSRPVAEFLHGRRPDAGPSRTSNPPWRRGVRTSTPSG